MTAKLYIHPVWVLFCADCTLYLGMGIVKVLTVLLLLPIPLIDPGTLTVFLSVLFDIIYIYIDIYIYLYDRLRAELTLLIF